jgi:hypothetical protein
MELYPQFECRTCTARMKQDRGCDTDAPFPYWTDIKGEERSRCPRRSFYENPHLINTIISAYNHYQNGYLPHSGGLQDQSALFANLMGLVQSTIAKCEGVKKQKPGSNTPDDKESVLVLQ